MKQVILLFAILFSTIAIAQVPQGISYQAIALNGSGNPVVNSNVGVRLSVLDNSASGTVLYTESQTRTTNPQGLFNLVIGQGSATFGVFATINWKTNFKFLKVEMDVAGGTNYVLVGTTQLLSVPYALAAESLVLSPGEGITLISPNGTPYTLGVTDSGQLTLPTSGSTATVLSNLYLYGTFNGYEATTALLFGNYGNAGGQPLNYNVGYKYLTAGTEVKFLAQNNSSSPVYGINASNNVALNASAYTIPGNGFYYFQIGKSATTMGFTTTTTFPVLMKEPYTSSVSYVNPTYNVATNTFSYTVTAVTNNSDFVFGVLSPYGTVNLGSTDTSFFFGDNLGDGSIEHSGSIITYPGSSSTPKNYRVDLVLNFNGSGTYTITQL